MLIPDLYKDKGLRLPEDVTDSSCL